MSWPTHKRSTDFVREVYFLRPVGQVGPIKIGCSVNAKERLFAMNLSSPIPLELLAVVPGSARIERAIHVIFEKQRSHGEWFFPSPKLIKLIDDLIGGVALEKAIDVSGPSRMLQKRYRGISCGRPRNAA